MRLPAPLLATGLTVLCLLGSCASDPEREAHAAIADYRPSDGDDALEWLIEGNNRFREGKPWHDHESIQRRLELAQGQHPFGIILGCADSRVPPELLFDAGLGDLFVIRVAGNVVAEDEAGSIEYAVNHLDVPLIVVLGHEGCGAVTAALGSIDDEPEELITLLQRVRPALDGVDRSLPVEQQVEQGVEANVLRSVRQLAAIVERQQVAAHEAPLIVGAVYDLDTGEVRVLDAD